MSYQRHRASYYTRLKMIWVFELLQTLLWTNREWFLLGERSLGSSARSMFHDYVNFESLMLKSSKFYTLTSSRFTLRWHLISRSKHTIFARSNMSTRNILIRVPSLDHRRKQMFVLMQSLERNQSMSSMQTWFQMYLKGSTIHSSHLSSLVRSPASLNHPRRLSAGTWVPDDNWLWDIWTEGVCVKSGHCKSSRTCWSVSFHWELEESRRHNQTNSSPGWGCQNSEPPGDHNYK